MCGFCPVFSLVLDDARAIRAAQRRIGAKHPRSVTGDTCPTTWRHIWRFSGCPTYSVQSTMTPGSKYKPKRLATGLSMPRQGRFLLIFGRQNVAANGLPCGQYADFGARLTRVTQRPMGRGAGAWGVVGGGGLPISEHPTAPFLSHFWRKSWRQTGCLTAQCASFGALDRASQ